MPFRTGARLTIENTSDRRDGVLPGHVRARRRTTRATVPARAVAAQQPAGLSSVPHTILDGIDGPGQYVGTYLAWGVNSNGWWGEGEIKFYLDGDERLPDDLRHRHRGLLRRRLELRRARQGYTAFSTPVPRHAAGDPAGRAVRRASSGSACTAGTCPTRSGSRPDLRVDIQALGWRAGGRYLPLQDDIASTAFFYLDRPSGPASGAADGRRHGDPVAGWDGRHCRDAVGSIEQGQQLTGHAPGAFGGVGQHRRRGPGRGVVDGPHGDARVVALDQDRRAGCVQLAARAVAQTFLGHLGARRDHGLDTLRPHDPPSTSARQKVCRSSTPE